MVEYLPGMHGKLSIIHIISHGHEDPLHRHSSSADLWDEIQQHHFSFSNIKRLLFRLIGFQQGPYRAHTEQIPHTIRFTRGTNQLNVFFWLITFSFFAEQSEKKLINVTLPSGLSSYNNFTNKKISIWSLWHKNLQRPYNLLTIKLYHGSCVTQRRQC